ncbi:cobalamin B12-binding domain-containing protein [Histidinibacterium aquaticum]|nr:cobalamin-dependent protein [Histidinibacterium aquaticum]
MPEKPSQRDTAPRDASGRGVGSLANRALSVVAARAPRPEGRSGELNAGFMDQLDSAVCDPERDGSLLVLRRMIASGIRPEAVADLYIPALARRIGEEWCADRLSFTLVTISLARLQGLLRAVSPDWRADRSAAPDAQTVLLVVPAEEQHTLGALVLAGQMRRRGISVRVKLGFCHREMRREPMPGRYDAVMISAARGQSLDSLGKVVETLRRAVIGSPPVVIGGSVVETARDLCRSTGADFGTNDLNEALDRCDLNQDCGPLAPRMMRT